MSVFLVGKNTFFYVFFEVINKAMPFLLVPILTHYFTPKDMGLVAEFTATVGILTILIGLNVHGAISVSFIKLNKNELSIYNYNVILILLSTVLIGITVLSLLDMLNISFSIVLSAFF